MAIEHLKKRKTKTESDNYSFIYDPEIEPYYVEKDQYCYTVKKKNDQGENSQLSFGHYSNFSGCLKRIIKLKMLDQKNYDSIQDFILKWETIQEKINKIINPNI